MLFLQLQQFSVFIFQLICLDFDRKAFEQECRKIVNDISEKFLDLGLDEGNHSDFGQDLIEKQARYKKEFQKLQFNFETQALNKPKGGDDND